MQRTGFRLDIIRRLIPGNDVFASPAVTELTFLSTSEGEDLKKIRFQLKRFFTKTHLDHLP